MFKKLVSGLPFSPALVSQLGFYARRLKKEETTRRIGLILTALALIVQSFTVFSPPEAANAANSSDLVYGGVSSLSGFLAKYDQDPYLRNIMNYAGITRDEIAAMRDGSLNSREHGTGELAWKSWGRTPHFSAAQGEVQHNANGSTAYSRPLWLWDSTSYTRSHGSTYSAFRGTSARAGDFAILKGCGNLVLRRLPVPEPRLIKVCRPNTGVITIRETERLPTDAPEDSDLCKPKPAAACTALTVNKIDRTRFTFTATASTANGATISKYSFIVRNAGGAIVSQPAVSSTNSTATTDTIDLKDAGNYVVNVKVATSIGEQGSQECTKDFAVNPPDVCPTNPDITVNDKDCQPCPGNPTLWYKDRDCQEKIAREKTGMNLTQDKPASDTTARAGDRLQFTVTAHNIGKVPAEINLEDNITDILEYANVHDNGHGTQIERDGMKLLSWGKVKLAAGEKASRTFTVTILDTIPATPQGASDRTSYDCIITNTFGNSISVGVDCAPPKIVETVVEQLPSTGPTENMIFAGVVGSLVVYFWARSRQLGTEVRLIRRDFNTGAI